MLVQTKVAAYAIMNFLQEEDWLPRIPTSMSEAVPRFKKLKVILVNFCLEYGR